MKSKISKAICITLAFFLLTQPALLSAHDFGGPSDPESPPGQENAGGEGAGGEAGPNGSGNNVGGNIYLWDGSEFFGSDDLTIRGVFPIRVTRYYNSRSTYDSPLGYGWDFSYNERLFTYSDGSVLIRWSTGFKKRFISSGGGFVSDDNFPGTLVQEGEGTFVFTSLRGMKHRFDLEGKLVSIQDFHGNELRMSYTTEKKPLIGLSPYSIDTSNSQVVSYDYQLTRVEEWDGTGSNTGRYVVLTYDGTNGRLVSITDFAGRIINYHHDTNGNLVRVDYPESLFKTYSYEDPNDKHNITAFGRGYSENDPVILFTNQYDNQDRVITQTHAGGITEIAYTIPLTRTTVAKTVKNALGDIVHEFSIVYEFNDQGYIVKYTDAEGNVNELVRDSKGNCLRDVIWKNLGTASSPNLVEERVVNYTYDSDRNLTSKSITLDSGESITRYFTHDHGWLRTWSSSSSFEPNRVFKGEHHFDYRGEYPKHVSQRSILVNDGATPVYRTTSFTYNIQGQLTMVTYGNGDNKTLEYTDGFLTNVEGISLGRDNRGNIITATDLNNNHTFYEYDQLDRATGMTNALNVETILTFTGYHLTSIEHGKTESAAGQKWYIGYDETGRMISFATDMEGSPTMQKTFSYDSEGNMLSLTNVVNQTVNYTYDTKNRLTSITDAAGKSVSYQYDIVGGISRLTDPNSKTTYYYYDDLGRLIKVRDPLGNESMYDYNAMNLLIRTINALGKTASFEYDLAGQRIRIEKPMGQTEAYHYDGRGRLDYLINANGHRINYAYNNQNYLETITFQTGSPRTFTFGHNANGSLTSFTDSEFSTSPMYTYSYDELNRIDTVTLHPINKTLDYDYDNLGMRKKLTCKAGITELFSINYGYDSASRLTSLNEMPLNKTTTFTYDMAGQLSGRIYPNGSLATVSYKSNGLLDQLAYQNSGTSIIEHYQYSHDDMGYITSINSKVGTSTITYDDYHQLQGATFPVETGLTDESYSYDSTGNRLTSTAADNWYYDDNGRLVSYGNCLFNYDGSGNQIGKIISGETTSYDYDDFNRLTAVTTSGSTANYTYDHLSRRIKKEVNGVITWFMYDGNNLLSEFDNSGSLIKQYCHMPGTYAPLSITEGSHHYPVLTNHLGSPVLILDENETPVWKADYQTFGQAVIDEDPDNNGMNLNCNLRLPGQYFDQETDLYYNIARYYNPKTGRFLQVDPVAGDIMTPLLLNGYPYTRNSPLHWIDPDGRLLLTGIAVLGFIGFGLGLVKYRHEVYRIVNGNLTRALDYIGSDHSKMPDYESVDPERAADSIIDMIMANFATGSGEFIGYLLSLSESSGDSTSFWHDGGIGTDIRMAWERTGNGLDEFGGWLSNTWEGLPSGQEIIDEAGRTRDEFFDWVTPHADNFGNWATQQSSRFQSWAGQTYRSYAPPAVQRHLGNLYGTVRGWGQSMYNWLFGK